MYGAEPLSGYKLGGYHPVHLGDKFQGNRFVILHKLGWGSYSTIWLARDTSAPESRCVALKIIVSRLANASNEIEILQYLHDVPRLKNHPGREHILSLLDHFVVSGPNGTHNVLVFDVVGPGPDQLRTGNEVGEEFVWKWSRIISKEVALGVSYLHELGVTHSDLHGWNIAFSLPDLKGQSDAVLTEYLNPPSMRLVPANDDVSKPKYLVEPGSFANYMLKTIERNDVQFPWKIKIIDFGGAFFTGNRPTEIHTPLFIRAPELVFNKMSSGVVDQDWGSSIDIWSLGCLLYEIIAQSSIMSLYDDDVNHLCTQYVQKIGLLPERWQAYWSGKELHSRPFERYLKSNILIDYRELTGDDTNDLSDLLRQMLVLDPKQRRTIQEILKHKWFTTEPNLVKAGLEEETRRLKDELRGANVENSIQDQLSAAYSCRTSKSNVVSASLEETVLYSDKTIFIPKTSLSASSQTTIAEKPTPSMPLKSTTNLVRNPLTRIYL